MVRELPRPGDSAGVLRSRPVSVHIARFSPRPNARLPHVCRRHEDRRVRSRARRRARRRAAPPGRPHRADRVGELRQPARARGTGLGADEQVRRRLSRASATTAAANTSTSPSSWRSIARRSCSAPTMPTCSRTRARRRTRPRISRCSIRRHDPRHEPRPRRPSDARREGQFLRQAVQGGAVRARSRNRRDRLRAGRAARAGTPSEADHRRLFGVFARHRLGSASARSPMRVGAYFLVDMAHVAGLVAAGIYPSPVPHRRRRHDDDAQDAARSARRPDPRARRTTRSTRNSIRWSSRARRAVR